jgi:hypothetical protein
MTSRYLSILGNQIACADTAWKVGVQREPKELGVRHRIRADGGLCGVRGI